jgi:hypothetical protein
MSSDAEHDTAEDRPVTPLGPLALAGLGAALLCNAWVLEGLLAKRSDLSGSWISDLAARSEAFGWRFELLEIASGIAVCAFALLLLQRLGQRSSAVRYGLLALLFAGVLTVIGGAAPLNCAEALDSHCSLHYELLDVIHTIANVLEILATGLAFGLLAVGLRRLAPGHLAGRVTLAIGVLWLLLIALTALSYLSGDVESIKGLCQRGAELLFGGWLVLLGVWAEGPLGVRRRGSVPRPEQARSA